MKLRALLVALLVGLAAPAVPVLAESPAAAPAADTYDLLRIPELLEVMREEGMDYGQTLAEQLYDNPDEPGWAETVSGIYETGRLARVFRAEFDRMLEGDEATRAAAAAFFGTEPGQTILGLEIEARRALLDEPVEEAAALAFQDMADRRDPRVALLEEFADINDLVEANVAGALNANLAFLKGMAAVGGGAQDPETLLADVRGQAEQVRAETVDWLFPFLALAYQPLSDEDMRAYIEFSKGPEGQRLNRALFAAFDVLFSTVSADLGRAAGLELRGQDI
ncbi:hypothetical protein [Neotabrizicola shimadae]|uniref:DUF2059 domain-containing protein n=1 Tax=Neotabrizicola shimadae TaxID=2807096 RepID=A0A8G0ZQE8_9RHOB|nr:hypothetical protein [Neotabrizicola shimadae]QYZ68509.1 hypothetical protein JO391_12020 [Neotabrizicola shimadae]